MPLRVRLKGGTISRLSAKSNGGSSGSAVGKKGKGNRREDLKGQGTRFADGNKSEKKREQMGLQENTGRRRHQGEVVARVDRRTNALEGAQRKRKSDDDSQGYDDKRSSLAARKGGSLKSISLNEDDSCSGRRTNRKASHTGRGGKGLSKPGKNVEISRDEENIKGKKFDRSAEVSEQKGGAMNVDLEEHAGENGKSDQITEEKHRRPLTRVLDKTGKKIRISKKDLISDSEESTSPKKKKRMKLDPFDTSNKRIDDSVPHLDEKILVKSSQEETEMSINAKFRAIQPSSSILSFVEDNLIGRRRLNEIKNAGYNVKISAPLDNGPFSTSTERERIEEAVFRNKLEFFAAAKVSSSFPPPTIPEVAFAGVSNVGKSSLINSLTRQWGVVRTSDKPGLTQTINFFRLASKLRLVDLPGYGFAYAKDEVKESWQELVKEYVSTRVDLQRVCLLVHTKRGMKPLDYELVDLMERSRTPYQIVLTKTDLVFPIDVARRAMEIQESLKSKKSVVNPVMMVSSKSGAGIRNLRTVLGKLARFIKP